MIEAHLANTTNGLRVAIALREAGVAHRIEYVNLWRLQHKTISFTQLNPVGQTPVIVDTDYPDGSFVLAQTAAILMYVAEKSGALWPTEARDRARAQEWVMLQATDLSCAAIQLGGLQRMVVAGSDSASLEAEALSRRIVHLYRIMDKRLTTSAFLTGPEFSVTDIMAYPMASTFEHHQMSSFTNLLAWCQRISNRPQVIAAKAELAALHQKSMDS